jgi:CheY-like chemotaxis protein
MVPLEALGRGEIETILIVEDDPLVRETIAGALRRLGHQVREADNGRNALRLWSEYRNEVRLVITDMVMPDGMNGLELVEHLRRDNPDLAAILVSGYRSQAIQTGLTSSNDILFLSKPFSIDQLSAMINQALGR